MATDQKTVSGFCGMNQHEGTRPRGHKDMPLKVCTLSWCECDCHKQLDMMFQMSEMERVPQPNPEYIVPQRTYWMPSDEPDFDMEIASPDFTETGDVSEAVINREVKQTLTGRTQRGGLEYWVQRECLAWLLDPEPAICGPGYLSAEIQRVEGLEKPPSQGAIGAVFNRWRDSGYAIIEKGPVRFVDLTPEGRENGLEWCKAKARKKAA